MQREMGAVRMRVRLYFTYGDLAAVDPRRIWIIERRKPKVRENLGGEVHCLDRRGGDFGLECPGAVAETMTEREGVQIYLNDT